MPTIYPGVFRQGEPIVFSHAGPIFFFLCRVGGKLFSCLRAGTDRDTPSTTNLQDEVVSLDTTRLCVTRSPVTKQSRKKYTFFLPLYRGICCRLRRCRSPSNQSPPAGDPPPAPFSPFYRQRRCTGQDRESSLDKQKTD